MPTTGDQSVPAAGCCTLRIKVKPLRIELARERNDLLFADGDRARVDQLSAVKLVEFHHRSRIRNQ